MSRKNDSLDEFSKQVGQKIVKIRLEHDITQEQLANSCGIGRKHLYLIENGIVSMRLKTLESIARNLDISVSDLVKI